MRLGVFLSAALALLLATWTVATQGDPEKTARQARIARLIRQLGDERFANRVAASKELAAIGEPALEALRKAAAGEDLEVRRRAAQTMLFIMPSMRKSAALGLTLVRIDAGELTMGSPIKEYGRRADEAQHLARITRTFYLGAYEVTQDEFRRVMKANPSWFSRTGGGADKAAGSAVDQFPVENVSWFDAVEFCNRLSALDGHPPYYRLTDVRRADGAIVGATVTFLGGNGYRLPTEAEWEYSCRAGTKTRFHYGNSNSGREANLKAVVGGGGYGAAPETRELGRTTKVGLYPPNAWGLYDMHGNVAEWCEDWYDRDYYAVAPPDDPRGPPQSDHRVQRGGHWLVGDANCRSASRSSHRPDERTYYTGFRVARTP